MRFLEVQCLVNHERMEAARLSCKDSHTSSGTSWSRTPGACQGRLAACWNWDRMHRIFLVLEGYLLALKHMQYFRPWARVLCCDSIILPSGHSNLWNKKKVYLMKAGSVCTDFYRHLQPQKQIFQESFTGCLKKSHNTVHNNKMTL